jgi:hypothetical protein
VQSSDLKIRLPTDLRQWVAEEGLRARRSMNAIIVDAVSRLKATRTERLAGDNHAAAIELAISLARLPKGTAIMLQIEHDLLRTDILVLKPSEADWSILASVDGGKIVFADNPNLPVLERERKMSGQILPASAAPARRPIIPAPDRIGLSRAEAAEDIGVSTSLFEEMVADGRMPPAKQINSRKVWMRTKIEKAFADLPDAGQDKDFSSPWRDCA